MSVSLRPMTEPQRREARAILATGSLSLVGDFLSLPEARANQIMAHSRFAQLSQEALMLVIPSDPIENELIASEMATPPIRTLANHVHRITNALSDEEATRVERVAVEIFMGNVDDHLGDLTGDAVASGEPGVWRGLERRAILTAATDLILQRR